MKTGKIQIIGIGPGHQEHMSLKAVDALKNCDVVIGYKTYLDLVQPLINDKQIISSGMRKEKDRSLEAIAECEKGKNVAVISSGDAGIYGMAGLVYETVLKMNKKINIEVIAGISALNAAASLLGAPLMHDFACISLSDLLTDFKLIKKRVKYAAASDMVIVFFNPRSNTRKKQIEIAKQLLLKFRKKNTPVGIVKNAMRDDEKIIFTNIAEMLDHDIDMKTIIIVGNSQSFITGNLFITPRGYYQ